MTFSAGLNRRTARLALGLSALALLGACSAPLDFDLRGNMGAFSTASAAQQATATRPAPDDRGIISYPNYQVAVARRGDTVDAVATRIGVPAPELARFNGLKTTDTLRDGEVLALPVRVAEPSPATGVDIAALAGNAIDNAPDTTPANPAIETAVIEPAPTKPATAEPVRHKVVRGETAYTIARLYEVPVRALAEWNGLGSDFAIREGQFLLIPVAGSSAPRRAPVLETAAVTEPGSGSPTPTPPSAATPLPAERVAAKKPPTPDVSIGAENETPKTDALMVFPVQGKIIRAYSKGRNEGIDIAADPGSPVKAAADGTVAAITSNADQVPIVVLRHKDNLLTVYANVTDIKVKKDQRIKQGQQLAALRDGSEAYVHFEVRDGFDSVNPIPYLE
ncbi:MAG: peptidoglycan DD-metalloendopeptidase family protein [Arenibacterium sp.]